MTDHSKTTAGAKGKTKDIITQLKKETEGVKDAKANEHDEIDWDRQGSEDEEETTQKKGPVMKQGAVGTDKPKKLRDLFDDTPKQQKPKTGTTKPKEGQKKPSDRPGQEKPPGDYNKPKFTNTRGIQNKDTGMPAFQPKAKADVQKKFVNTGALLNAAEENAKVKGPAKDYLQAESSTIYKEEAQIEKPHFVYKNVEGSNEPHFREMNKQEDLFLKKLTEKPMDIQNVYSEPRVDRGDKDNKERPPYQKKQFKEGEHREFNKDREHREFNKDREHREFNKDWEPREFNKDKEHREFNKDREHREFNKDKEHREFNKDKEHREFNKDKEHREYNKDKEHREYKPREQRERRQEKEEEKKEVDSDGFEIVTSNKTKPEDFRPKRRNFENRPYTGNKDRKPFKKNFERREKSGEKKDNKQEDRIPEENSAPEKEVETTKVTPAAKKGDKEVITIKMDPNVRKLRDLF